MVKKLYININHSLKRTSNTFIEHYIITWRFRFLVSLKRSQNLKNRWILRLLHQNWYNLNDIVIVELFVIFLLLIVSSYYSAHSSQPLIQDFTLGEGALLGDGSGALGPQGNARWVDQGRGEDPRKLLGIRKYWTSFLNRNWLKLYHVTVRHDASHLRYVQWSMIFYSWRKALLRCQYEEQQSKAFACSRKIGVILYNAHYPISLRSKEKELIRMFEMVLGRGNGHVSNRMEKNRWKIFTT